MRRTLLILVAFLLAPVCVAQAGGNHKVKVAGCVMSINGQFKLLTQDGPAFVLKGDHNALLGYTGMLIEVTGTVDPASKSSPKGDPEILRISKLKKLADTCE